MMCQNQTQNQVISYNQHYITNSGMSQGMRCIPFFHPPVKRRSPRSWPLSLPRTSWCSHLSTEASETSLRASAFQDSVQVEFQKDLRSLNWNCLWLIELLREKNCGSLDNRSYLLFSELNKSNVEQDNISQPTRTLAESLCQHPLVHQFPSWGHPTSTKVSHKAPEKRAKVVQPSKKKSIKTQRSDKS